MSFFNAKLANKIADEFNAEKFKKYLSVTNEEYVKEYIIPEIIMKIKKTASKGKYELKFNITDIFESHIYSCVQPFENIIKSYGYNVSLCPDTGYYTISWRKIN